MDIWTLNVYTPTVSDPVFWDSLQQQLLMSPINGNLIVGGDLNMPINPILYRLSDVPFRPSKAHKALKCLLSHLALRDPWKLHHPKGSEFTFYSALHSSYSRIDYILVSAPMLHLASSPVIDAICISDHAAIHLDIASGVTGPDRSLNGGLMKRCLPTRWD